MNSTISRRNLLAQVATTAGLGWVVLSAACKGSPAELSCTSTAGLTPDEVNQRNILKYVDKATDAAKPCSTCAQYKAGAADACGSWL